MADLSGWLFRGQRNPGGLIDRHLVEDEAAAAERLEFENQQRVQQEIRWYQGYVDSGTLTNWFCHVHGQIQRGEGLYYWALIATLVAYISTFALVGVFL